MTRPGLGPNQLSWCRLNIPGYRDMERKARAMIRDTEASKERHQLRHLAEIECTPNDRSK